uniref:Fibronectin type-III domain-containing protein n=1 Tax=Varanus komodoensis TaxID=61221 RepID=A0A8D2JHI2_VARKO
MGATVNASCTVWRNRCPFPKDEKIQMLWKLDEEFLKGSHDSFSNGVEVSNITIGPLNETKSSLSCFVQKRDGSPQRMNLIQIQAGYPPSPPQNLTCVMNASSMNLTCQWDAGRDSLLPVSTPIPGCSPAAGQSSCTIARQHLRLYQKMLFLVSTENALGAVESARLCADPADLVLLEPPSLLAVQPIPGESGCAQVAWQAASGEAFPRQLCELRYREEGDPQWVPRGAGRPGAQHCGLLFGTPYHLQMRCRKLPAGYWSGWSAAKSFTTPEKGARGWQEGRQKSGRQAQLRVPRPHEAHGKILGYWATLSTRPRKEDPSVLCNTTETWCTFSVPAGTQRIYLTAYNSKGSSKPTEVHLLETKGKIPLSLGAAPLQTFQHLLQHNRRSGIWCEHWGKGADTTVTAILGLMGGRAGCQTLPAPGQTPFCYLNTVLKS